MDMLASRISRNFGFGLASRITTAVQFAAAHSVYPPFISIGELTTAQALILSLFHCLLCGDVEAVLSLLPIAGHLPQLRSSFIAIWLRDDYDFRQEDVAKVLSVLAQFIQDKGPVVPLPILLALSGLEEKYDVFNFYYQCRDTTAQELLAYLNPLITRATQTGLEGIQDKEVQAKKEVTSVAVQTALENWQKPVSEDYQCPFSLNRQRSVASHFHSQNCQHLVLQDSQPPFSLVPTPYSGMRQQPVPSSSLCPNSFGSWSRTQAIQTHYVYPHHHPNFFQRLHSPSSGTVCFTSRTWQPSLQQSTLNQSVMRHQPVHSGSSWAAAANSSRIWHQTAPQAVSDILRTEHQPAQATDWSLSNTSTACCRSDSSSSRYVRI